MTIFEAELLAIRQGRTEDAVESYAIKMQITKEAAREIIKKRAEEYKARSMKRKQRKAKTK